VGTTSKPEVQARSKSGDVLRRVMYPEKVMHEAATPAPTEASCLEEKGRIATEVSPLSFETCHTLYTFSPIKDQHRNTAEDGRGIDC